MDPRRAGLERRDERRVPGENADLPCLPGDDEHHRIALVGRPVRRDEGNGKLTTFVGHRLRGGRRGQLGGLLGLGQVEVIGLDAGCVQAVSQSVGLAPPHSMKPGEQPVCLQTPARHCQPACGAWTVQSLPHVPQLAESVCVLVQVPPHFVVHAASVARPVSTSRVARCSSRATK